MKILIGHYHRRYTVISFFDGLLYSEILRPRRYDAFSRDYGIVQFLEKTDINPLAFQTRRYDIVYNEKDARRHL